MNANDLFEIEQMKFYYEQAYAIHRHLDLPYLFCNESSSLLDIDGDLTLGIKSIIKKFAELAEVSPCEDSYHTGWQICTPLIEIDESSGEGRIISPTFGYLVLNFHPDIFQSPYTVCASFELWDDVIRKENGIWKTYQLHAKFMLNQPVWKWNAKQDSSTATRFEMKLIQHSFPIENYKKAGGGCS